jgi:tripartite-type tricarboxylate transporter receptor subunit TctC
VHWILVRLIIAVAAFAALAGTACSQSYPSRPVRFIIPFPPGGPADIFGRLVAIKLSQAFGEHVVVDNRGGGNGNVGAELAARAAADGYTLMLLPSALAANASLYSKLPYSLATDFTGVASLGTFPLMLVAHPSVPAKTVHELVALAKSRPGELNFASAGSGGGAHLAAETFARAAAISMVHVPYKGTGPAVLGLLGSQVSLMFASVPSVIQHVRAGKLNALAVTSAQRSPALPELPTLAEQGLPGYELVSWFGVVAPAGTAPEVVKRVNEEIHRVLAAPEFQERLKDEGGRALLMTPEQFSEFIGRETARWAKIVRAVGAKLD